MYSTRSIIDLCGFIIHHSWKKLWIMKIKIPHRFDEIDSNNDTTMNTTDQLFVIRYGGTQYYISSWNDDDQSCSILYITLSYIVSFIIYSRIVFHVDMLCITSCVKRVIFEWVVDGLVSIVKVIAYYNTARHDTTSDPCTIFLQMNNIHKRWLVWHTCIL